VSTDPAKGIFSWLIERQPDRAPKANAGVSKAAEIAAAIATAAATTTITIVAGGTITIARMSR